LDLHLSNVVSSAPLPPPKEPATMSKVALNVAARVLPASVVTRAVGVDRGGTIDPSPAASMAPREPTDFPMVPPGGGTDRSLQNTESDKESVTSPAEQQRQKDESSTMDVRSELEGSDNADPSGSDLLLPHSALHASQHSLDVETLWPRDWLPDAFPTARITSLGYSTSLTMKSTGELHSRPLEERAAEMAAKLDAAGVGQDGRRVVWVVHSMGGLIVKQILLQLALAEERHRERAAVVAASGSPAGARRISSADEEGVRSPLLRQTAGVVFYSTPHMGTWIPRGMLSHQNMLSNAFYPSYELLDLQNIGKLRELNAKFKTHVVEGQFTATHHAVAPAEQSFGASASSAPLPTLSLGEGVGTPLLHLNRTTQRVVSWRFVMPDSSRPGFGEFLYFPTQNHLTICKPKTMLDENYTAVRKFIAQAIRQSGAQAGQPTTPDQETTTHATSPATKQGKLPHN
jgi:pimeloyl-ACP methyl ester carboxylesterase